MPRVVDGPLTFKPYALLRKGNERKWDGWYDLLQNDGRQVRSFVRVPSQEGFADPDLVCQAGNRCPAEACRLARSAVWRLSAFWSSRGRSGFSTNQPQRWTWKVGRW